MGVKNNRGFTLVELLAVIVILAVIILIASNNVGSIMIDARKNALALEGSTLIDAAKTAYQIDILNDGITGSKCYNLEELYKEGYFSKGKDKDGYTGSVLVDTSNEKIIEYTFWISNGKYVVSGPAGTTGKNATAGTEASKCCGGTCS